LKLPPHLIIYDDKCSFCRSSVRLCRSLDWLGAHRYEGSSNRELLDAAGITPEQADQELKLVSGGRIDGGFDAIRRIMLRLPLTFFWAPLLWIPPIPWLGRRVYRAVAARRKCTFTP